MDERFTAGFWDERYGSAERIWSGNPNPQLVAEAAGLAPGTALDAGCGEGADAHWLAAHGWRVTALDVSAVALERAAAHADPEWADRITWRQADLTAWEPDGARYDLVSAQFMQFPTGLRERFYARLAEAVAPGGTLLVVAHDPSVVEAMGHAHGPEIFFTARELAESLDPTRWEVLVAEARGRPGRHPDDGHHVTVEDAVLRARRISTG
jgi:SAM-dependent methyltransferase